MAAPYLGGFRITALGWLSGQSLAVAFSSTWGSRYQYQLYAGRSLIGTTKNTQQRIVVGELIPSEWPQHITLLAVLPGLSLVDYGRELPRRPYNKARITFSTAAWPDDAKLIELSAGSVPGGAVDPENVVERIFFDTDGDFEIFSPPMPGSGQWNFEVAGRDNRLNEGNRGTALAVSAQLLAHPPDVVLQSDNTRFAVAVAGGQATVTFENP